MAYISLSQETDEPRALFILRVLKEMDQLGEPYAEIDHIETVSTGDLLGRLEAEFQMLANRLG